MAKKSTHDTPADEFIYDRWAQARDLSRAYRQTMNKMRRRFKRVGQQLETSLGTHGYDLHVESYWAEFKAYRHDWCVKGDDPLVVVAVGGLFPVGYFRVEEPAAYLSLYLEGFEDDQPAEYRRFADLLYKELGGRPTTWDDRTDDENWVAPLYAAIPNTDDAARISLARNPQHLKSFALEHFQKFIAIGDPITRAVKAFMNK